MRKSEKELFAQEVNIRPNRYVAIALAVLSFFLIGMLLADETGFYLVGKTEMRIAVFSSLIILLIPLCMTGSEYGLRNPKCKYFMIVCSGLVTIILAVMLNFHATLIILLPVFLAAQYPSRKLCGIAVICSLIAAVFAPPAGYLLGVWDTGFTERLCQFTGGIVLQTPELERMGRGTALAQIFLYLSFPHASILLAIFPLFFSIAKNGEQRLHNQIRVLHMSQSDALTGLLNRLSFEETLSRGTELTEGNISLVYVDGNNLHRLNNEKGHAAGDRMLICIAECMREAFGDESVYRYGGDEFIALGYGHSFKNVEKIMADVVAGIEEEGYSVAVGIECAQLPCTLPYLVNAAEAKMMIDKKRYHIER